MSGWKRPQMLANLCCNLITRNSLRRVGNCQDHKLCSGEAGIRTQIFWSLGQEVFPVLELSAFLRKQELSLLHSFNHSGKMRRKYTKMLTLLDKEVIFWSQFYFSALTKISTKGTYCFYARKKKTF